MVFKIVCEKCGREFTYTSHFRTNKKYCEKCSYKAGIKTQEELARIAHRKVNDTVQSEIDKADLEGVSYGVHMARKGHGK